MTTAELHQLFLQSSGVCTDTRKIEKDCLFIALKGENFNGNAFAREAIEKGAKAALVDEAEYADTAKGIYLNDDTLKSLQSLARFHRDYLNLPILALTGSNGKTTTKELIHAVLSQSFNCMATRGNLNNHIGVPLTLLSMNEDTEFGIVEMGANHQKEIEALCEIAAPDFGFITNFGKAHLEGFGGIEGVIKGKSELYRYLAKHEGTVFVNAKDPKQMELTSKMNRLLFCTSEDSHPITRLDSDEFIKIEYKGLSIQTNLIGDYNFNNLSAAISIGSHFNVPVEKIKLALEAYQPRMNRSEIRQVNNHRVFLDAYNANPTSMMAALQTFEKNKGLPKAVILGDMFELGKESSKEHEAIVEYLNSKTDYIVLLLGKNFYKTTTIASHIHKAKGIEDAPALISKFIPKNADILLKGSRGMALERCIDFL